jgi:hypothetical protein
MRAPAILRVVGVLLLVGGSVQAGTMKEDRFKNPPFPMTPLSPQSPVKSPFVTPTWGGGFLLPTGQNRWRMSLTYSNVLTYSQGVISSERPDPSMDDIFHLVEERHERKGDDEFYFDAEVARLELEWARGLPGRWEVGAVLVVNRSSGGMFDDTIDNFHEEFGFSDAGRSSAPANDVGFILATDDGGFALDNEQLGDVEIGDLTLMARYGLPDMGKKGHAELGVFLELPTGDEDTLAGSGNVDVALEYSMGWQYKHSRLTFGVGYAFLGDLDGAAGVPVDDSISAALAWEVRLRSRHRIIAQILHATSPFDDSNADGISESTDLLALGPRFALNRDWYLDVTFIEDYLHHNSDLDVAMTVNVTWLPGGSGN